MSGTTSSSRYANGRTPLEFITGETPDISEYLDFGFYDWVVYKSNAGVDSPELVRWLGVSHRTGPFLLYWILPASGIIISCNTVQHITKLEMATTEMQDKMSAFTDKVNNRMNAASTEVNVSTQDINPNHIVGIEHEDEDFLSEYNRVINSSDLPNLDVTDTISSYMGGDEYIGWKLVYHMVVKVP